MAKPATTHVIEIETGIGEPAFIPLTLGQELQPISVGKKGMWRIESARVLDVHAFVYFDGTSLFLQSADENASASVDGYKVGKAWTELHAPCHIEIGAARLRYRSLLPDAQPERPRANTGSVVAGAPPQPAAGAPPHAGAAPEPPTFPKADRPFKPGEFATSAPMNESTRIAPIDGAAGWGTSSSQRPILGQEDKPTRIEGRGSARNLNRAASAPSLDAMGAGPASQPIPHGMPMQPPPSMAPGMMGPGMPPPAGAMPGMMPGAPGMMPPPAGPAMMPGAPGVMPSMAPGMMPGNPSMAPTPGPYPSYPGPAGSGAYNSLGPGVPGGYGSMTSGQMAVTNDSPLQQYIAKYKELSLPRKILVFLGPLSLAAAAHMLLFDDPEPPPRPASRATVDAGVAADVASAAPPPTVPPITTPAPSVQAACPPGFVPYTAIEIPQGGVIPCVPAGTPMPAPTGAPAAGTAPPSATTAAPQPPQPVPAATPTPAPAPVATGNKTLERQAVDYAAAGDYARAAAVYEQLQAQNPNNPVYGEAVRILRMKADAGGH